MRMGALTKPKIAFVGIGINISMDNMTTTISPIIDPSKKVLGIKIL